MDAQIDHENGVAGDMRRIRRLWALAGAIAGFAGAILPLSKNAISGQVAIVVILSTVLGAFLGWLLGVVLAQSYEKRHRWRSFLTCLSFGAVTLGFGAMTGGFVSDKNHGLTLGAILLGAALGLVWGLLFETVHLLAQAKPWPASDAESIELADEESEGERPWDRPGAVRRDCQPHRGPLLQALGGTSMVLGLLSLTFCLAPVGLIALPLGAVVWVMARRDLRKMALGLTDPAGRSQTERARGYAFAGLFGACGGLLFLLVLFIVNLWQR